MIAPLRSPTVRLRLTIWYTAALALLLAAYAIGVFLVVRHNLRQDLDPRLHEDAEIAEELLIWTADDRMIWRESGDPRDDSRDSQWLEVSIADGRVVFRSAGARSRPLPSEAAIGTGEWKSIKAHNGEMLRVHAERGEIHSRPVIIRVAESEQALQDGLASLGWIMGIGLPIGLLLAAAGGYSLARRALAPVDRMATQARQITAERLGDRLPIDNPRDELGRLAEAFNATLHRLQESFNQMRRFVADASHELRTPLTAIRSVGEVGLQDPRSPREYREVIGSMLEEVDRLGQLLDGLLTLSRADAGKSKLVREPLDLSALVDQAVTELQVLAEEKDQRLVLHTTPQVAVMADALLLRRAISNLVDNAIKYSPPHTNIDVRLTADGRQVVLDVIDQGPGIAAEDQPHVFDRFYRVDRSRSRETDGTGLGLAIAQWVIDAHGGKIELTSDEGRGSTFRIVLPLRAATAE